MAFVLRNVIVDLLLTALGARHLGQHLYCDLAVPAAGAAVYRRAAAGAAGRDRSVDLESPFPAARRVVEADRYRDPEYRRVSGAAVYCRLSAAGGLAAVIGAIQPLLVMLLAWCVDRQRSPWLAVLSALMGIAGMAMLLLSPQTTLEPLGIAAAFLGAMSMALGTWLSRRWAIALPVVALTGWQLLIGGIVLAPMAFLVDPPLHQVTLTQAAGYLWLCVAGAMLAYGLWFRGIGRLSPVAVSAMSLLSPVTAVLLGWIFLGQKIEGMALVGLVIVLFSVLSIQRALSNKSAVAGR